MFEKGSKECFLTCRAREEDEFFYELALDIKLAVCTGRSNHPRLTV